MAPQADAVWEKARRAQRAQRVARRKLRISNFVKNMCTSIKIIYYADRKPRAETMLLEGLHS